MEFIATSLITQEIHARKWVLEQNNALVALSLERKAKAAAMYVRKYHHPTWKQKKKRKKREKPTL